jgi:aspartyl-tRNA(Asn)/glutamyl-tRNA(Gln) amidotransferase subunit B
MLQKIKTALPELPEALEKRYTTALHLSAYDASVICDDKDQVAYFEAMIGSTSNHKAAANWLLGPIKSYLNDRGITINSFEVPASKIAALIGLVETGKLSFSIAATKIFPVLLTGPVKDPLQIATELNLIQESDSSSIEEWVNAVIAKMPDKVRAYQSGKKGLIGLFAGEVKKISKGKADMLIVNKLLEEKLKA